MKRGRGFTLIEALVSILILSVVMIVALTLLVSMRSFAAKQQAFTAPRQSARAAVDYLSFFLAGASDLNTVQGNPNALVMWTTFGSNVTAATTLRQASFNDLTAAQETAGFGDAGTDIISLSFATNPIRIPILSWTGDTVAGNTALLNYSAGCGPAINDDTANFALFKQVTGATTVGANEVSGLLPVQDSFGRWRYLQITRYVSSNCAAMTGSTPTREVISIEFAPGSADQVHPPGGWRNDLALPLTLNAGVEYTSFRVKNRTLEQKTTGFDGDGVYSPGFFNPDCDGNARGTDCPSIGFTPVVENVEDLQVAYVFRDGTIWNTGTQELATNAPNGDASNVPAQAMTITVSPSDPDVRNVRALRVSTIARSNPLDIGARGLSGWDGANSPYRRAALEDHTQGPLDTIANGVFDRYRLTTTLVLRNRMLGY